MSAQASVTSSRTTTKSAVRETTMRAAVQDRYGGAEVLHLAEVDRPTIADDEVLVRVHAAGVARGDWHVMTGRPYLVRVMGFGLRRPKVGVRGQDLAGTVESVGAAVTALEPGDEVYGWGRELLRRARRRQGIGHPPQAGTSLLRAGCGRRNLGHHRPPGRP